MNKNPQRKRTLLYTVFWSVFGTSAFTAICLILGNYLLDTLAVRSVFPIALLGLVVLIISFRISVILSKKILNPIDKINLLNPEKSEVYREFEPLLERIEAQNQQISRQFEQKEREHSEQDAMRRDFTANVSHELKTPLTSISGYAEIMKSGLVQPCDIPRFAEKIYDESGRLITLVGDIIKLSQLDDNEIAAEFEPVDLYEVCKGVLSHLELSAREKNVTMNLTGERVIIRSVDQIVEEIVFNLCDNAIKYNKEGGRVDVFIRQCLDGVEMTVRDTGIGIAEKDLEHIYERFYRVEKSHSRQLGGTGLGLSIVKHGARYLGAKISTSSVLGEGTTVRVLF